VTHDEDQHMVLWGECPLRRRGWVCLVGGISRERRISMVMCQEYHRQDEDQYPVL
jgi:hypothetical protein